MAIKRIQLRGISRTPSDRMTEDGGCAESLNVFLENGEIAPIMTPLDITNELMEKGYKIPVYLHATQTYTNVILQYGSVIYHNEIPILNLSEGESVSDITHIGNTLIIATTKNPYYLLYKNSSYQNLGSSIELPAIQMVPDNAVASETLIFSEEWVTGQPNQDEMFNPSVWNKYDSEGKNTYETAKGLANFLSDKLTEAITTSSKANTHYVWPLVARYAIRLYNGSVITSVPYLIAPQNIRGFSKSLGRYTWNEETDQGTGNVLPKERIFVDTEISYYQPHIQLLGFNEEDLEKWSDVIQSIEIYFSDQITPDKTDRISVSLLEHSYNTASADINIAGEEWDEEKAILEKSVFFKVASYDYSEAGLNDLINGTSIPLIKSDDLLLKERLDPFDDVMESRTVAPQIVMSFNNRLLAAGITGQISSGPKTLTSTDNTNSDKAWSFRFFVESEGSYLEVIRRNEDGGNAFVGLTPYSWITYPDVKCSRVDISTDSGLYLSIKMKEHPNLDCSYAYLGRKPLEEYMEIGNDPQGVLGQPENKHYDNKNKLFLSDLDNPMVFPMTSRYTIGSGSIIGMAVASKALSQGQFGQFPLYVFTTDGIWAMSTNDEGTFSSSSPLSREVCNNAKSITPLDQEIVFTTDKGLMLLSGSEIMELSPYMNGPHQTIRGNAQVIINSQSGFETFESTILDSSSFADFLFGTKCAYDYISKRLILINSNYSFQYVYALKTQTWHKMDITDYAIKDTLNSYPNCYVYAVDKNNYSSILNLSVAREEDPDRMPPKGIVVTRAFDLAEPDVLKVIKDIRIKGQFAKKSVKFILQGSQDNINWYTISTLRGKSWKLFRIIILADLNVHDRISWIDIQYETRFTNKLR